MNKQKTSCLTGHRPKSLPWGYDESKQNCKEFKTDVKQIFISAINYGIDTFFTGMAEGFDTIGAEILLDLRETYKYIKIIAVIPSLNQSDKWSLSSKRRYKIILDKCDEVIVISQEYTPTCMMDRNKYMVEHSNFCIACYNGKPSGTGKTIKFAKENGCKIRIINPDDYSE